MKKKLAIIGDGGWGTTLAILLDKKGFCVSVWGAFRNYIGIVRRTRENKKFLPGIKIPRNIQLSSNLKEVIEDAHVVVLAVPSKFLLSVLKKLKGIDLSNKIVVSVIKGIESSSLKRISQIIKDELNVKRFAVLSGPTIAREVANHIPTTAVVASKNIKAVRYVQDIFMTDRFRIYTNADVIGVELGGSLKNIIAIACGISDGLGFGANTKAAILSRGLIEMARLGEALGAKKKTFWGISGLGDLVTTCVSKYSRNRFLGEQIGRGKKLSDIVKNMDMVAEGITTSLAVFKLSRKYKIEMPISNEIYKVLYKNKSPLKAVNDLMRRKKKSETF